MGVNRRGRLTIVVDVAIVVAVWCNYAQLIKRNSSIWKTTTHSSGRKGQREKGGWFLPTRCGNANWAKSENCALIKFKANWRELVRIIRAAKKLMRMLLHLAYSSLSLSPYHSLSLSLSLSVCQPQKVNLLVNNNSLLFAAALVSN